MFFKSAANWAENISAGSMLIGIFDDRPFAVIFGLGCFFFNLIFRWAERRINL